MGSQVTMISILTMIIQISRDKPDKIKLVFDYGDHCLQFFLYIFVIFIALCWGYDYVDMIDQSII